MSHPEHFAVCTRTIVKAPGSTEHAVSGEVPGVRGMLLEGMCRCAPPGVEGIGVWRCTRMVASGVVGLMVVLAPGVLGAAVAGDGVGVVARAIVERVCGDERGDGESEEEEW